MIELRGKSLVDGRDFGTGTRFGGTGFGGTGFMGGRRGPGILAAGTAVLLLAGCGGGGGDAKATALDRKQVASVLPDAKAVPGWRNYMKPDAQEPVPDYPPSVCRVGPKDKREAACKEVAFWGTSSFAHEPDGTTLNFWALAYKDEKAADTAYDLLAGWYGGDRVGVGAKEVDLGGTGAEREANRAEVGAMGGPGTIAQVRVGTTVLGISTGTQGKTVIPDERVRAFAATFAERAQQAQDGDRPTAAVPKG
ncbi:hypothetical protein [Streptomyces sp. NPDC092952]|uniref:hypothetical protein n=1 Tax=Streptomyces sp. NPDC092952 TaxID=3366018 RepID=UPI00381ECA35